MKHNIAGLEKNIFWERLCEDLKLLGFIKRTKTSLMKIFEETIVMVQLQTSAYNSVDYYVNMTCIVKELNKNGKPIFDRDGMNSVRLRDNCSYEDCLATINFYCMKFSNIETLKEITKEKDIISSPVLREYLGL